MSRTILRSTITVGAVAVVALGASVAQGGSAGAELSGPFLGLYTAKLSTKEAISTGRRTDDRLVPARPARERDVYRPRTRSTAP